MLAAAWTRGDILGAYGIAVSAVGVVVSVVGFGFAVKQLKRTATATEAANSALERTERRMALSHLLVLIPQIRMLDHTLDQCVEDDERRAVVRTLSSYAYLLTEIHSLVIEHHPEEANLRKLLEYGAQDAAHVKASLVGTTTNIKKATFDIRQNISVICGELMRVTTTVQAEIVRS